MAEASPVTPVCDFFLAPAADAPASSPFHQLKAKLNRRGDSGALPCPVSSRGSGWARRARRRGDFHGLKDTCSARPVLILQHPDSFERENPQKHKNAAIADGFSLLVFPKMALVHRRGASRDCNGDLKSQLTSLAPNEGRSDERGLKMKKVVLS